MIVNAFTAAAPRLSPAHAAFRLCLPLLSFGSLIVTLPLASLPLASTFLPSITLTVPVAFFEMPFSATVTLPEARSPLATLAGKDSVTLAEVLTVPVASSWDASHADPRSGVNCAL